MANIITRRWFMKAGVQATLGLGLASLTNIPPFLKRALAEGNIGLSGKKLLFIFLRGGNDGVNNLIPIMDPSYRTIVESGWNRSHALAGVSIQSNLPASLRGTEPMTNLSSINRYNLLGVYSPAGATNTDRTKLLNAIDTADLQPHPAKDNRDL